MAFADLSTLSEDWRRDHDYHKVQDYLHDFKGVSMRQRTLDDLSRFLLRSKLEWAYNHGLSNFSQEVALVTVTDPLTNEILDVGGSIPGDLFVDNFGLILSTLISASIAANTNGPTQSIKNTSAAANANGLWGIASNNFYAFTNTVSGAEGTQIQIGSGTTAPARADIAIQTAFGTSPESAAFFTGSGAYTAGSGIITGSGSITSGGSGTINEAVLIVQGNTSKTNQAPTPYVLAHDATTATAFTASKSITIQYSIAD